MRRWLRVGLNALALGLAGWATCTPLAAAPVEINIQPYATRTIATYLVPNFPTGEIVPPLNTFGVPFFIPAEGRNFFTVEDLNKPLAVRVGVFGVKKVYTLIQAYGPHAGDIILTVDFAGSAGARQRFPLVVGAEVRDFFESGFCRTINNTTARPAFEFIGHGGAYTDDVTTGPRGFYDFDEQEFVLEPSFAKQTLTSITFTRYTTYGTPMILGITALDSTQPPPAIYETARFWIVASVILVVLLTAGAVVAIQRWLNAP